MHPRAYLCILFSILGALPAFAGAQTLTATLNGPGVAVTVQSNSPGPSGGGLLIADVTLTADAVANWTIATLAFASSGTVNATTAFNDVQLHEDAGPAGWQDSATDPAAAGSLAGFTGGQAVFALSVPALTQGSTRRFFLVVRLSGTATTGQTLNAHLDAIAATGGTVQGVPTAASSALIIDVAFLTLGNAPGQPPAVLHEAGTPAEFVAARFRLTASNANFPVTAINLTSFGTMNPATQLHPTRGIGVWVDNGDGFFSQGTDTLLFEGAGGAAVNAVFTTPLALTQYQPRDLWVIAAFTATSGIGAAAPATFGVSIVGPADVLTPAGIAVLLNPPALGPVLRVVDFFVSTFTPVTDIDSGGADITITGSGFMVPFYVSIGGVLCPGVPVVTPTQVTGLSVPIGAGTGLAIVVTSGVLTPITLPATFDYGNGFLVTSFSPLTASATGTDPITITGQGFVAPVEVSIGGVVCPGNATIGGGGTTITGLYVPRGSGSNLPIVVTCGTFAPQTLAATFTYTGSLQNSGTGGCIAMPGATAPLVALVCGLMQRRFRRAPVA